MYIMIVTALLTLSCSGRILEIPASSTEQAFLTLSPTTTIMVKPEKTEVPKHTPLPVNTPRATSTAMETSTSTPTIAFQADIQIIENCVAIESTFEHLPDGTIALRGETSSFGELLLYDLTKNQMTELVGDQGYISVSVVSPDHRQIAFIDVKQSVFRVVDATGKGVHTIPVIKNWYSVILWVDQDHLLIENIPLFPDGALNPPASSVLYDISEEEVEAEYPHGYPRQVYLGNASPDWGPYYFTQSVFDPDFTRVIYPAYPNLYDAEPVDPALTLWDVIDQREIAHFWVDDPDFGGLPQWSKDGSYFIAGIYPKYVRWDGEIFTNFDDGLPYIGGYELFRVSRDGALERLTFFSTQHNSYMQGYSLSPDEKRVAFWLVLDDDIIGPGVERRLAILDTETGIVTDLCVSGGDVPYQPVWSPDGQYLIITVSDGENSISDVFLLDIAEGYAMKIAEQAVGLGWLTSSP